MLLDTETLFSDAQAITASTASTNIVKMAGTSKNMTEVSFGKPIPLLIQVVENFEGCTSVKAAVETSADENFSNPKILAVSDDVPVAELAAGYKFPINYVPKGNLGYMRINYTVVGTATAGKITAGVVTAHDNSFHDM